MNFQYRFEFRVVITLKFELIAPVSCRNACGLLNGVHCELRFVVKLLWWSKPSHYCIHWIISNQFWFMFHSTLYLKFSGVVDRGGRLWLTVTSIDQGPSSIDSHGKLFMNRLSHPRIHLVKSFVVVGSYKIKFIVSPPIFTVSSLQSSMRRFS